MGQFAVAMSRIMATHGLCVKYIVTGILASAVMPDVHQASSLFAKPARLSKSDGGQPNIQSGRWRMRADTTSVIQSGTLEASWE